MSNPVVKLRFQNGLTFQNFKKEVFDINGVSDIFDFEETPDADFIIFGPYGNDIPQKGNYTRIGYFCENIKPDMAVCEWAFGVPREVDVNHPRYKRIQWHGTSPQALIKPDSYNAEEILKHKKHFCNFVYSHKVPYREEFFRQLSKYKKIDSPGKSMNNMESFDSKYTGDRWQRKRQFLNEYKFTIAFENDAFPGYQTEKLYDAMQANSIPIYHGDPYIGDIFNTKSFINMAEYIPQNEWLNTKLTKMGQMDFDDILPTYLTAPKYRLKRKLKSITRGIKMQLQFRKMDFEAIIERIIALDKNPELYLQCLKQPWLNNNKIPQNSTAKDRWIEIFNT